MKLNKYQKHYYQHFKKYREAVYKSNPNYKRNQIQTNKIYWPEPNHRPAKFNTLSTKLMRNIGLVIRNSVYCENGSSINPKKEIDGLYLKETNTNVYYVWDSEFSRFDAFICHVPLLVIWNDTFLNAETYKLSSIALNYSTVPEFSTVDFNQEFTEEFIFQQSLIHDEDLVEWQRIYKVLKVLNSTKTPLTIAKIYAEFIK